MPLTDGEREITKAVVHRLLSENKPSPHKELVRAFKSPKSLERLVGAVVLSMIGNREAYLPKVLAFHYCGDEQALLRAKTAVTTVLHVLRNLFEVNLDKEEFTPADVEQQAQKMYDSPPSADTIKLGLFLLTEFANVFTTCGYAKDLTGISFFGLNDNIITLDNIDNAWDEQVRRQSVYVENGPVPVETVVEQETEMETAPPTVRGLLVFISHSSKDAELASALIELLKSATGLFADQIRCSSVDGYRLPVGVNTEARLREEVNAVAVAVGLITPSSLDSDYVMFELGARWGARRFLAPLLAGVKPGELSGPLSLLNALLADNEAQLHQLLKDVSDQLRLPLQNTASYLHHIRAVTLLASRVVARANDHPVATQVNISLTPSTGQAAKQFLAVKNHGSKQTFRAQCRVLQRRNDPNGQKLMTINLEWEHGQRDTGLARGESGNLLIATAGLDVHRDVEWMEVGRPDGYNTLRSTWPRNQRDKLPEYDLEITVISTKSDESFSEQFTLSAGTAYALEMKRKIRA